MSHHKTLALSLLKFLKKFNGINAATLKDVQWIYDKVTGNDPMEWSGYMTQRSRQTTQPLPATNFIFGPLIDAQPSHPDTILTALSLIKKSLLKHMGKNIHMLLQLVSGALCHIPFYLN